MIPFCKEAFLDTHKKSSNISTHTFDACSQFIPAFSNNGLCLTRNGARLETIFRKNLHLTNFQDVFIPQEYNQTIRYISEEQSGHHLTFFVDGNKYNDLKRGIDWTKPSFSSFPLAIHPPNETGDIRGWANREINVLSGQLTKIRISLSQQKSKESVRSISIEKRECKFSDENEALSSFKWYSNVNCLLDCKLDIAESICGCRPWEYPTSTLQNNSSFGEKVPICNFDGNSCFNRILQRKMEQKCKRMCIQDCDQTNYQVDISMTPLDPNKRICDSKLEPFTLLEHHIKNYVQFLFLEKNWHGFPPERRISNIMKDILRRNTKPETYGNDTNFFDQNSAFKKDCERKLEYDIAAVIVSIDSPTFPRTTKNVRVTFQGKLANIGRLFNYMYNYKSITLE